MSYPKPLYALIQVLRRLPGVGLKTAERYAFHLLDSSEQQQRELCTAITHAASALQACPVCGCLCELENCSFCTPARSQAKIICAVASMRDIFAIEETGSYQGLYHVLGGVLSPMDRCDADQLAISSLIRRIQELRCEEVILALDSTLEGDTTALYIREQLASLPIKISRPAFGLPLGSSFSYVDGGTLTRALMARNFL